MNGCPIAERHPTRLLNGAKRFSGSEHCIPLSDLPASVTLCFGLFGMPASTTSGSNDYTPTTDMTSPTLQGCSETESMGTVATHNGVVTSLGPPTPTRTREARHAKLSEACSHRHLVIAD
jgi:hypothetical protein